MSYRKKALGRKDKVLTYLFYISVGGIGAVAGFLSTLYENSKDPLVEGGSRQVASTLFDGALMGSLGGAFFAYALLAMVMVVIAVRHVEKEYSKSKLQEKRNRE